MNQDVKAIYIYLLNDKIITPTEHTWQIRAASKVNYCKMFNFTNYETEYPHCLINRYAR